MGPTGPRGPVGIGIQGPKVSLIMLLICDQAIYRMLCDISLIPKYNTHYACVIQLHTTCSSWLLNVATKIFNCFFMSCLIFLLDSEAVKYVSLEQKLYLVYYWMLICEDKMGTPHTLLMKQMNPALHYNSCRYMGSDKPHWVLTFTIVLLSLSLLGNERKCKM